MTNQNSKVKEGAGKKFVPNIGIYVPSYKRSDVIMTAKILPMCKYVVRESEYELYVKAGVPNVIACPETMNNSSKVRQWIIDNAEEDYIIQIDDDVKSFHYLNGNSIQDITDVDVILMEFERIMNLIVDLELGFGSLPMTIDIRKYNSEFNFKGCTGCIKFYNRKQLKAKYDENNKFKGDIDFELQELASPNRIMLFASYFTTLALYDVNSGGNTDGKNLQSVKDCVNNMKAKWGSHFDFNYKNNTVHVKVKR